MCLKVHDNNNNNGVFVQQLPLGKQKALYNEQGNIKLEKKTKNVAVRLPAHHTPNLHTRKNNIEPG